MKLQASFKRFLACLLVVLMVFTTMPIAAIAEETQGDTVTEGGVTEGETTNGETNPDDTFDDLEDEELEIVGVPVSSMEELEEELTNGTEAIQIMESFAIDRTLYITHNVTIYSETAVVLSRAADFGGDLFVVGQYADGSLCETDAVLTLGRESDVDGDLLTIDGNKDNVTVPVVGSALFVCNPGHVIMYNSVSIVNHKKVGNERTSHENVSVSYPVKVGGAAIILAGGSVVDIYGGRIDNNEVNLTADSEQTAVQGGAIYNYGTLNIYGGALDGNQAYFGGAIFNYRTINIHCATISNNYAADLGGAIYMPNSGSAFTYIGEDAAGVEAHVTFAGNRAKDSGGAIYARNTIDISNAYFQGNATTSGEGGAIIAYTVKMTMDNVIFDANQSGNNASAVYISGTNGSEGTVELSAKDVIFRNNKGKIGTLNIASEVRALLENATFENNTGTYGGAIYTSESTLDINGGTFAGNKATTKGGALYTVSNSTVTLNEIDFTGNSSVDCGVLYSANTTMRIYDSHFEGNTVTASSAVMYLATGADTAIYGSVFENNVSAKNGGVITAYTSGATVLIEDCQFLNNSCTGYGGVIHASSESLLELYCITATDNSAGHGGFMYITTTGTKATIAGLTLSGNTATTGGNNIWSNSTGAKIYLDQSKCVENDYAGVRDDAYWSAFVANKPKVYYQTIQVPSYFNYAGEEIFPNVPIVPLDVTTAAEFEKALTSENSVIRLMANITLDRTLYITKNTTIFGVSSYTLTRAADFAGDLFVVGQNADGSLCEAGVTLTLGREDGTTTDHLMIDGNKENLTVDVVGSALFVCNGAVVNLTKEVTLQNHKKVGNERTSQKNVTISYPVKVGGAVAIVTGGGTLNLYGSHIVNNEVNTTKDDAETSVQGGAIYNYGTLNVYDALIDGNKAYYGGAIFNYRRLNLYKGTVSNNVTTDLGGAIYMPNSTAAVTYIGTENDVVEPYVLFSGNQAGDDGGAIYARNIIYIENARFENNSTKGYGGAIIAQTTRMTLKNVVFSGNTATSYGGAIYLGSNNGKEQLELTAENVTFENNSSKSYAGAMYVGGQARAFLKNVTVTGNQGTYGGAFFLKAASLEIDGATISNNKGTTKGGAIYAQSEAAEDGTTLTSTLIMNKVNAVGNSSVDAGALYVTNTVMEIYASRFAENTVTASSAVMYLAAGADTKIYDCTFENNVSAKNGGVITGYSDGAPVLIQDSRFLNNSCNGYGGVLHLSGSTNLTMYDITAKGNSATHGGFMYETTTGTIVKLVGITVDDNTASTGGPIIYGNSTGAKLYIDKSKMTDLDHTGDYDDTYWKAAIYNKLKVYDISEEIPHYLEYKNEPYPNMLDAVDVASSAELEAAINAGYKHIRVVSDFEIDRTFYIAKDVTIFSTFPYTLTRAADFGGDIFLVGENADGSAAFVKNGVPTLTLGNPDSVQENLLTIDGNKANMTVDVTGTVVFVVYSGVANLHTNVTVINAHKNSNGRVYDDKYIMKPDTRVGGAVAIVLSGTLNVYGGNYRDNEVNPVTKAEDGSSVYMSIYGGAIYNYSATNIYGGTFANNVGCYGAAVYNYCVLQITGGVFENNYATARGGAIYVTDTSGAHTLIGTIPEAGKSQVIFRNNTAVSHGGALYSSQLAALVIYEGTEFDGNQAGSSGGAICCYGQLTAYGSAFRNNVSANRGGAVYFAYNNSNRAIRYVKFENCTFENNVGYYGGALSSYASSIDYETGGVAEVIGCTFTNNRAAKLKEGTTSASGGAIFADRRSHFTITDSTFDGHTAQLEGGTLYATGESELTLKNVTITNTSSDKHGGAITARSSYLNMTNVTVSDSTAVQNGGALYVSYNSNRDMNSKVNIANSSFTNVHSTSGSGGAIYATRRSIENEHRVLTIKDTSFENSSTKSHGGAIYMASSLDAYLKNVNISKATALEGKGGAIYSAGILEYDTGTVSENQSVLSAGGAFYLDSSKTTVLNGLTFTGNTSGTNGGAIYGETNLSIYNSHFENNVATGNGGALVAYGDGKQLLMMNTTLTNNSASFGGGIYASGGAILNVQNVTATGNSAAKGGFLYETTTGTTVTLNGVTLSGNTADEGSVIFGNSTGAVLKVNKENYVDSENGNECNVANELTVEDVTGAVTDEPDYVSKKDSTSSTSKKRNPVSVNKVFNLEHNSSEAAINSTYGKLPRLDNSSNFMSNGTTVFENINGGDVTVDTTVYHADATEYNVNFSQGMLIYQALLYKRAHPEEDVSIHITSYRFSVQAGLCINRDSRYFGYMRQMPYNTDYDEYGFVRIAFLLVTAAKMGVNVTIIPHIDAYPRSDVDMNDYFKDYLQEPCDPTYIEGDKLVKDYLTFTPVSWTLGSKGGTDMMHLKLCAVSDYLDMNGVEHHNAVWTSSSNLDGIKSSGVNACNAMQTSTIISDHADLYRISVNYVNLMAQYIGQEEIYEFQHILSYRSTKQIQLMMAGRGDEIPVDQQLVYIGSETDDVFELYFTPMGGSTLCWDETTNAYCKYLRELYESEDSIEFIWNTAKYDGVYGLGQQMEMMINASFHENKNVDNKVYMNTKTFTGESFSDLIVGQDIGLKSFNAKDFGTIHSKDMHVSYVKNGQRYYASLMNSMNIHSGSMYYQINHMLVIKETDCEEDSVYFTVMDRTTKGVVEHQYGDAQIEFTDADEHGTYFRTCASCGKRQIFGIAHNPGEWIVDRELSEDATGLQHRNCVVCGALAEGAIVTQDEVKILNYSEITGHTFNTYEGTQIPVHTEQTPHTFEVMIKLPTSYTGRGGVILGNYTGGSENQVNLEVYTDGKLRLYCANNGAKQSFTFNTDVRSDTMTHITLTVQGTTAMVYVNGVLTETANLPLALPENLTDYVVGGDLRSGNAQYFRGTIYGVRLFSDVRTEAEVGYDALMVSEGEADLLYEGMYNTLGNVSAHTYDYFCDDVCNVCGFVNHAEPHTYDDVCDASCNVCGEVRESGLHAFDNDCDAECNSCGAIRQVGDHIYGGACDEDCNSCGLKREAIEHTYDNNCDADCNVCGESRIPADHVYDDVCDPSCNECGAVRSDIHEYSGVCDADCNVCGTVRVAQKHSYTDGADTVCDGCGFVRVFVALNAQPVSVCAEDGQTVTITLDVIGDGLTYKWYFANKGSSNFVLTTTFTGDTYSTEMSSARSGRRIYCVITDAYGNTVQTDTISLNMLPHTYSAACDETCDLCGESREVIHTYSHEYDVDCDVCSAIRMVDLPIIYGGSSVSEDVSGLAFLFHMDVDGMATRGTTAVYDDTYVGEYKLLSMGALVTNGINQVDVPAVYLWSWDDHGASFAVRVVNIPEMAYDAAITATPYFVFEKDGETITIYGEAQTRTYNGVLNANTPNE